MRASTPTDSYEGFLNREVFFALIRLALAGDARATFPQGKAWGADCDRRESLERATPVRATFRNDVVS